MKTSELLKLLKNHSGSKTISEFKDYIFDKTNIKISEPNLCRWLNEKHEPIDIYKQIFINLIEKEL